MIEGQKNLRNVFVIFIEMYTCFLKDKVNLAKNTNQKKIKIRTFPGYYLIFVRLLSTIEVFF